jgi:hypothetical protein
MQRNCPRAEQLFDELAAAAPGIAKAIEKVPDWQQQWPEENAQNFLQALWDKDKPNQDTIPGFDS